MRFALAAAALAPLTAAAFEPAAHPGRRGPLTEDQQALARAAWQYFQNNYQAETCLYNAVDAYPSTSMWDVGSALAGLTSAYELGLVPEADFHARLGCMLDTLARLPMYRNGLPNKVYHTATLEKVDYANNPGELGVSALDLGRLLTWFAVVVERYPRHAAAVDRVVAGWSFCGLVTPDGVLYGAANDGEGVVYLQEGRLGYEEYAAYGYQRWGFDTTGASSLEPSSEIELYGVPVRYDSRDPARFGAHTYVVSEAWLLAGLEHGWATPNVPVEGDKWRPDSEVRTLAKRVYQAQERRWKETGILTARSEHQVEAAPFFVYDTVFSDGVPWTTIADDGVAYPDLAAVSTKAALGLAALFDTPYTDRLGEAVSKLYDPARGIYEGFYEADGRRIESLTVNTNGIVLETLLFQTHGTLLRGGQVRQPPAVPGPDSAECKGPAKAPSAMTRREGDGG